MKFKNYFFVSSTLAVVLFTSGNALACHKGETCSNGKPVPTIGGKTPSQILDELNKNKAEKTEKVKEESNEAKSSNKTSNKISNKTEKVKTDSSYFKAPHKGSKRK